jgi:serine/threonine protein kinase
VRSRAGDIWSLGVTLVECLTQRLPSWSRNDHADPVLPENLPAPFVDIVRGCLQRDPQRRSITVTSARFHAGPPREVARGNNMTPVSKQPATVRSGGGATSWLWRSAFPLGLAIVGLAAVLAGFGFLHRQPESRTKVAAPEPEESPKLPKPEARKPSPRTEQQPPSAGSHAAAPPVSAQPASLRAETPSGVGSSGAGGVVRQVLPDVPQTALDTIQGTIRVGVKVSVDTSGKVAAAELDTPGPSKYFARLSLQAAQNWKFATSGQNGGREFILYFEFKNDGTRAYARQGS